jgi:hypothetical protein
MTPLVVFFAGASVAEGQTTSRSASRDALIRQQIEAEWARADREAEKATPSFHELKAEWAARWERVNRELEKGLSYREQKTKVKREAENGQEHPSDRGGGGNRPSERK